MIDSFNSLLKSIRSLSPETLEKIDWGMCDPFYEDLCLHEDTYVDAMMQRAVRDEIIQYLYYANNHNTPKFPNAYLNLAPLLSVASNVFDGDTSSWADEVLKLWNDFITAGDDLTHEKVRELYSIHGFGPRSQ